MTAPSENNYDAIVIGSGLGGLSCALHLAKRGLKTIILEKQPKVGGAAQNFIRGDYYFDVSQHVLPSLGPGDGFRRLLEYLQVIDKLEFERHEPMFTSSFPGDTYALPGGRDAGADYLKRCFPREAKGIDRFVELCEKIIGANTELFWTGNFDPKDFFPLRYFKKTYQQLLSECVTDPKLHGLFGQLWQSTGLPNDRCAANWSVEVFGMHLLTGNYYIRGGGQALSNALAETLREAGGEVRCATYVTEILHKNRTAHGVKTATGEKLFAPIVVCNASPLQAYFQLIGAEHLAKPFVYKLQQMELSCSIVNLYLGLDCPTSQLGLDSHSLFVNHSYDNSVSFDLAMAEEYHRTDYMISDYTNEDSGDHPAGHGIAQILEAAPGAPWINLPHDQYLDKKERVRDQILDKVSERFPALKKHIDVCEMGTPRTLAMVTRNPLGAVYGFAQTPAQADHHRFGVSSLFKGLYFASAWARGGGGGYMGAMVNGRVAAREILQREQIAGAEKHIDVRPRSTEPLLGGAPEQSREGFGTQQLSFTVTTDELSPKGNWTNHALVRAASEIAERYFNERLSWIRSHWPAFEQDSSLECVYFHMNLLLVPFVTLAPGDTIHVTVEFRQSDPGKGELIQEMFHGQTEKKIARSVAKVLVQSSGNRGE